MKNHKIAVLGPHRRGGIATHAHQPERGFHITALCGHSPEGLDLFHKKCGSDFKFTTDYREVVHDPNIDIVFIATPDYLHIEHAVAALEAGKCVFLEKPMAIEIADCDRILQAAETPGARLYVGHNMRFFPVMRKMHELIQQGKIGEVQSIWCRHFVGNGGDYYFKNYNSERKYTNSLLLQKGAHDIDVIHWLAGAYTTRVVGMGKLSVYNRVSDRRAPDELAERGKKDYAAWPPLRQKGLSPVIDIEDHNMIMMQLENGVQACYLECFYSPDYHRNYTVIGTEGRLENIGDHSTENHWASVHVWNQRTTCMEMGHEVHRVPHVPGGHGGADPLMIEDFLSFVENGTTTAATPLDARMAVAVGVLGAESLRSGNQPKDVPAVAKR